MKYQFMDYFLCSSAEADCMKSPLQSGLLSQRNRTTVLYRVGLQSWLQGTERGLNCYGLESSMLPGIDLQFHTHRIGLAIVMQIPVSSRTRNANRLRRYGIKPVPIGRDYRILFLIFQQHLAQLTISRHPPKAARTIINEIRCKTKKTAIGQQRYMISHIFSRNRTEKITGKSIYMNFPRHLIIYIQGLRMTADHQTGNRGIFAGTLHASPPERKEREHPQSKNTKITYTYFILFTLILKLISQNA